MKKSLLLVLSILTLLASLTFTSALVIDSVIIDSSGIAPGETTIIELGLRNNANEDINDVSVTLDLRELPIAPFDSSSEFGIDEIREDRIQFAKFEVIALDNAKSQTYKIPVQISYLEEDETTLKTKNSLISLKIHSEPIMDLIAEDNLLLKGKDNLVSIKVINKGLGDIKFLEIEAKSSSRYNILSPKEIYAGDLDSDDFDNIDFKVFFKKETPDKVLLPITLRYKDTFNKEYQEDFNVLLDVYTSDKAVELGLIEKNSTKQIITSLIILIVLWWIYHRWRKKSKLKKRSENSKEF
jgi:hypothetical protein